MSRKPLEESYRFGFDDLEALTIGAALLGTGGGGNPYIGFLRAREVFRQGATVPVIPLEVLTEEDWIGEVGGIGAPVVSAEKFEQGDEGTRALSAVEAELGIEVAAMISGEIGGANAMEPVITAAKLGIGIVDGDGMGRAFPEVQMCTFFIYGGGVSPAAIADEKGNVVVYKHVIDMFWLERMARHTTVDMGATAMLALPPMRGDFVRKTAVPTTVTQAVQIGRTVLKARKARQNVVERVVEETGGKLFFTGKITDIRRHLIGGFARGEAILTGIGDWAGSEAKIAIQNENLVLWVDGVPVLMVPDLIINLELDTGEPLTTEVLRYGQRIAVIGLPVHDLMKTPKALEVVGPAAFGYPELTFNPLQSQPKVA